MRDERSEVDEGSVERGVREGKLDFQGGGDMVGAFCDPPLGPW